MSKAMQIEEAIKNADANIELLATFSDKRLAEKLDTIHLQSEIAIRKKQTKALELLEIWRSQIIAARIHKAENKIADAPNEIAEAIANIETYITKTEQKKDALRNYNQSIKVTHRKESFEQDKDSQLSLF